MMHDICRNNQNYQARLRRQSEKFSGLSGAWVLHQQGAGFSFMPAHFFCPPEITLHTLHAGSLPGEFCGPVENNNGRWFDFTVLTVYE